jgi:signal transduction histidine kinase
MFDEAQRMQRLIEDLISLSRIEAEKYRIPDKAVDLADLIEEVTVELREAARAADLVTEIGDVAPVARRPDPAQPAAPQRHRQCDEIWPRRHAGHVSASPKARRWCA